MQQLGGEIGDGLPHAVDHDAGFVAYTRGNVRTGAEKAGRDPASVDVGCTSSHPSTPSDRAARP